MAGCRAWRRSPCRASSSTLAAGRPHEVLLLPDAGHQVMSDAVTEGLLWHQVRFLQRHLGVDPAAAPGLRPFRTTQAELVMRRGRRAAKRPRLGMAGVTESPLGAWGKMATTVVEPAAAVPAGSCPRTVTPGSRPQAHPEVPVVTESALPNPDEDRLKDLQETRAQIEQAKGILMATYRCGPDEAFELLRRASRGGGVKVHVLAARLIKQVRRRAQVT